MLSATTVNPGDHHHHHALIGDVLLHSERKITIIQVVTHSLSSASALVVDQPIVRRLSPNPSSSPGAPSTVGGDLKNNSSSEPISERSKTLASKKIMRMQKAGWALVKELKSKVRSGKSTESGVFTTIDDDGGERTHF